MWPPFKIEFVEPNKITLSGELKDDKECTAQIVAMFNKVKNVKHLIVIEEKDLVYAGGADRGWIENIHILNDCVLEYFPGTLCFRLIYTDDYIHPNTIFHDNYSAAAQEPDWKPLPCDKILTPKFTSDEPNMISVMERHRDGLCAFSTCQEKLKEPTSLLCEKHYEKLSQVTQDEIDRIILQ